MEKKKEIKLSPMSEHPAPDTVVRFHYKNNDGKPSSYYALWTGEEWKCRKPYKKDEWEAMPDIAIEGWDQPIDHQELLRIQSGR